MKKKIICLALSLMCLFTLCACDGETPTVEELVTQNKEFTVVYTDGKHRIIVHNETKVMYLFYKNSYGGGLTVMLDENGEPLLWEEE